MSKPHVLTDWAGEPGRKGELSWLACLLADHADLRRQLADLGEDDPDPSATAEMRAAVLALLDDLVTDETPTRPDLRLPSPDEVAAGFAAAGEEGW